jgi:chromosome segregation ATPase
MFLELQNGINDLNKQLDEKRMEAHSVLQSLTTLRSELEKTQETALKNLEGQLKKMENNATALIIEQQQKVEGKYAAFKEKAEKELEERKEKAFASMEENVTKNVRNKVLALAIAVVSLAALAMIGSGYTAMREVNQSILTLQEKMIAAQDTIQKSNDAFAEHKDRLVDANTSIKAATNDLNAVREQLEKARTEYNELAKATRELQQKR